MRAAVRAVARSRVLCSAQSLPHHQANRFPALIRNASSTGSDESSGQRVAGEKLSVWKRFPRRVPLERLVLQGPSEQPWEQTVYAGWRKDKPAAAIWLRSPQKGKVFPVSAAMLRENCECPQCRDPSSGQKKFPSVSVDPETKISSLSQHTDGLLVRFDREVAQLDGSGHETLVSWKSLELMAQVKRFESGRYANVTHSNIRGRVGSNSWDAERLQSEIRHYDYHDFMQGGDEFWRAVSDIIRLGLVFLKNVPEDPKSVEDIANTIGHIKETLYGRTFDVKAKPNAENVAYTSEFLGLHQDLLYLSEPPALQLLHCIENSCDGGESLFSDSWRVIGALKSHIQTPGPLDILKTSKIMYGYHKNGHNYVQHRRVLHHREGSWSRPNLFWSPPFQDLDYSSSYFMRDWIRAARVIDKLLSHEQGVYKYRMQPGECVIFDNIRVLHGRRAFDTAEGSRWLRGTYLPSDAWLSKASQIPPHIEAESLQASQKEVGPLQGSTDWEGIASMLMEENYKNAPAAKGGKRPGTAKDGESESDQIVQ